MTERIGGIVIWVCVIWVAPILYMVLRNEAKFKKNIAVGVTLPYEGRVDPEVQALLEKFKRQVGRTCLGLCLAAVVLMCVPMGFGLSLTLCMLWVDAAIILPYLPYIRCNRALKEEKKRRGWRRESQMAELPEDWTLPERQVKKVSSLHILLPAAISLIPCIFELAAGETLLGAVMLVNPLCVLLFWLIYRYALRKRPEAVDENDRLTAELTRLRRETWRRCWLWMAWFMAVFSLCMWLGMYHVLWGMAGMAASAAAMLIGVMRIEFRLRSAQERLTRECGRGAYADEDDRWLWGIFYYVPGDRRLVVNDRVGMGTTVNLARRGGQILMGLAAALLIVLPFLGLWVMGLERAPVTLTVTESALVAGHHNHTYEISLDDMERVELLESKPPIRRIVGTGMTSVQRGQFRWDEHGELTVCLDPRTGPWLLITTADGTVYLLGSSDGDAGDIYTELLERRP